MPSRASATRSRRRHAKSSSGSLVDRHARRIAAGALAAALVSGVVWFVLVTAEMGNLPFGEALKSDVLEMILQGTQFGSVAAVRLTLALAAATALGFDRVSFARWLAPITALMFVAGIAWTGHSGSGFGISGNLQLTADALHLVAASAWIGGLVPLALLLSVARKETGAWIGIASDVTRRFSTLGLVSVATLIASGTANAWFPVGSIKALTGTEYGRVLVLKLVLFVVMIAIAAINRNVLTPRLAASSADGRPAALATLVRHCVYEIALGFTVISVASWLGTLHPAAHFMN